MELYVSREQGDSPAVYRVQVGFVENFGEVSFRRLLKSIYGALLESQLVAVILGDLSHQSLEREFRDEGFGTLLVHSDLPQRHRTRSPPSLCLLFDLVSALSDG